MMPKTVLATAIAFLVGGQAFASSDGAWNALFAKANGTCIGLSGLDTPEASTPVVFDDSVGKIAILLKGAMGRGKVKTNVSMICLYDKKSGKASIEEYRWLGK
ncbi:hypothetical protein [Rhizobium tubonense]|uniref:Uncharacterized protein n=1 Tax=Rhizobium tubonense TaxID=484088 RepID=A0A2W4E7L3_9HYPH|nr:hypothetical protein [Rhizobium tubonense]PZM08323.1 hypothetical protein CPY51_29320 [Rhizobium tubonense]